VQLQQTQTANNLHTDTMSSLSLPNAYFMHDDLVCVLSLNAHTWCHSNVNVEPFQEFHPVLRQPRACAPLHICAYMHLPTRWTIGGA
jgi:hypothetical protein